MRADNFAPGTAVDDDPIGSLISTVHTRFPDLGFLSPSGVLNLRQRLSGIDRLRLELPPGQFLQIQSLGVAAEGVDDAASLAEVTLSSWRKGYEGRFDIRRLLDFDAPSGTTICTETDEPAWLEMRFSRPLEISEIRLRNVADGNCSRARGITVSAGSPDGTTVTVYDGVARGEEVSVALSDALADLAADVDDETRLLVPVLAKVFTADYAEARTSLEKMTSLSDDRRRSFRDVVSRSLLYSRSLEWTVHGPQRCFRFWSEAEKIRYVEFAVNVVADLRKLTPNVCFGFGAALAAVRDGDLIPHDDDLDIIVGFEEHEAGSLREANRLVEELLRPLGYDVTGNFTAHRHVKMPGEKKLDVFVGLFEGDTISWYPGVRGSLTRQMMFPTSEGAVLAVTVPLPHDPDEYLEKVYGPTWRVPDAGFKHVWDRSKYADISKPPIVAGKTYNDSIAVLISAVQGDFGDLEFLTPGGALHLDQQLSDVVRIVVELHDERCLHVQSVGITADGVESVDDLATLTTLRVSSWFGAYEDKFDIRRLLDFDAPSGTVVHTNRDRHAWFELSFATPLQISDIRLRNVAIETAWRARGIKVRVAASDGTMTTVYDGTERERELDDALRKAADQRTDQVDDETRQLIPVVVKTMTADYAEARKIFEKSVSIDTARRQEFRVVVSRLVLFPRSLEWTLHGPRRCFRFWTKPEQVRYVRLAAAIAAQLRDLTPNVCFGFGAALSVVRDHALIPHDDDLDIVVGFEPHEAATLDEAKRLIADFLRPLGYEATGKFTAHRQVRKPRGKSVDVFVGLFEGDTISWYPGARGSLTRQMMFPASEGALLGVTVPLPREPEEYLEKVYGPSWRVPDPGFAHV